LVQRPSAPRRAGYRGTLSGTVASRRMPKRIVYVQYTNPGGYPPLEHSSRILADAGWEVLFLGTGALGEANALRFPAHPSIAVKQLSFCPAGFRQKIHYVIFGLWVLAWVLAWRPRWVYASDALSCPVALALSCVPGLRIIYHEHDSPSGGVGSGTNRFVMWCRRVLARCARYCILPNQRRVEQFEADTGADNVLCVWNCPCKGEITAPRAPLNGHDVWLLYHGSIGPSRLPLAVLTALARLPDALKLRVIGYETVGTADYLDTVRERARDLGILHRVDSVGPVPHRSELMQYCQRSDIGLALMPANAHDINMRAMTGASNKAFDYLASGLPVLVSDLPDWKAMFVDPGYGLACAPDDPCSLERALRWLLDHPAELRAMGERGRQRIEQEWNYEMQFGKVAECVKG
jgi:glycosyltransferase involved in cell wall biosynthesis